MAKHDSIRRGTQRADDSINDQKSGVPVMDGCQATRHIPIVAMTANAMEDDRERCLDAGVDGSADKKSASN